MRKFPGALLLGIFFTVAILSQGAQARRIRVPILLPHFGNSERLVKVRDLPDIPLLRRKDGRYVDLGYLFPRSGKGRWVGYIDKATYIPLSESGLAGLLLVAGLKELPPPPKRPSSSAPFSSGGMMLVFMLAFFWWGFRRLKRLVFGVVEIGRKVSTLSRRGGEEEEGRASGLDEETLARALRRIEEGARMQQVQPPATFSAHLASAMSPMPPREGAVSATTRFNRPATAPAFGQNAARPVFGQRRN